MTKASLFILASALAAPALLAAPQPPDVLRRQAARLAKAVAMVETDPRAATRELKPLLDKDGRLQDYALFYLARAKRPSDPASARTLLARLVAEHPDSAATPIAVAELAELLAAAKDQPALLELMRSHGTKKGDGRGGVEAARLSLALARVLADSDPEAAMGHLLDTRRLAPGSQWATAAAAITEQLRAAKPGLLADRADDMLEEARLLGREGAGARQAALLDRFLASFPRHPRAVDAVAMRAAAMARIKDRESAARWLEARAARAGTASAKARLVFEAAVHRWNGHDSGQARAGFEAMLALATGIAEEQRAEYALGRIHEAARRYNAAARSYRHASQGKDQATARESRWRAGWASYLAGNFEGAAWVFAKVADRNDSGRGEALYWQARSLARAGKGKEAAGVFALLIKESPDSFHALLAEARTGVRAPRPRVAPINEYTGTIEDGRAEHLARARALHGVGLTRLGESELAMASAEAGVELRRALLPAALDLKAFSPSLREAFSLYYKGALSEAQLYPYIYPLAFSRLVEREAGRHDLDPMLVYALMRQESLFDPRAASPASAYGLMQLILPTAKRVAATAGIKGELTGEQLFDPAVNIALGTAYLAKLWRLFDGDPVLVLAGYNAGEKAARRWSERLEGLERDERIEGISYRETREYVKKVLRNLRNYHRLYPGAAHTRSH